EALATYNGDSKILLVLMASVLLSCMGTNVLTCYVDRDIDSIMKRTIGRPLPMKKICPRSALSLGFSLLTLGILLASLINIYVVLWGLVGAGLVFLYNSKLKRATPYSILIASPAGAMPILGAYSAMTGDLVALQPLVLALLIVFWTPIHIWSLVLSYKEDYRMAGVCMFPVVRSASGVTKLISLFTTLYVADAFVLFFMIKPIWISFFTVLIMCYPMVKSLLRLCGSSSIVANLSLFRLSSLHLGVILLTYLALSVKDSVARYLLIFLS
ncbi:protoheme IX farnesyltransferase, partial [Candidatus Bathyarchaeota archaeon]|nr:protoheme IX farnesyltransferase [Candidatus Bathyarchaeota archaeon]